MTQKEYNEKILESEKENKDLRKELEFERRKNFNYEQVLEDYHRVSEELNKEREANIQNEYTIKNQNDVIEKYKEILDKFTINY
jgi:hypothetical protein